MITNHQNQDQALAEHGLPYHALTALQAEDRPRRPEEPSHRQAPAALAEIPLPEVPKDVLKRRMADLFGKLGIQGEPIGVGALQEEMRGADLEPDELTRGLIEMRER